MCKVITHLWALLRRILALDNKARHKALIYMQGKNLKKTYGDACQINLVRAFVVVIHRVSVPAYLDARGVSH